MAYVLPGVNIRQVVERGGGGAFRWQSAHISGGNAQLIRYTDADEKDNGLLGYYDPVSETCYDWPNRPAGGLPDFNYTKVYIEQALLRYFEDLAGSGDTIETVASYRNRVRANATVWSTNGAAAHSSSLLDRGARVGDIVRVRASVSGDDYTLWSYIAGFVAEVEAATVAAAVSDAGNAATQADPGPTHDYIGNAALVNCVIIDSVDDDDYDGLLSGDLNETYTVRVIQGSIGGDATTARLRITSASGNDDVASVTPSAFGAPTEIGTRGLLATFDTDIGHCSLSADNNDISTDNFIVGQEWEITCGQGFTAPTATSGGTYTGAVDQTYIVTVTRGGLWADLPQITVTTNKGLDLSGPTNVTAASSAVAIGTKGVTISFNQDGLRTGDIYTVAVTAASAGPLQTIRLGHDLPQAVIDNGATEVDLTLYLLRNIEVSKNKYNVPGEFNYSLSETEICLSDNITATDSEWTDGGSLVSLPVYSASAKDYGRAYVHTRYWLSDLCNVVLRVDTESDFNSIPGPNHPDNPLKYGVGYARLASGFAPVLATSVCNPDDVDSWARVLELLDGREDVWSLVPLTRNATVLDQYAAHVQSQSQPEARAERVAWFNAVENTDKELVSDNFSSDGEVVLASLSDDPETSGTQYTQLSITSNNLDLIEAGVLPGDTVRYLFSTDGYGGSVYSEFTVDSVTNETTLRLLSGHSSAVTTPQKIEIWRTLNKNQISEDVALQTGAYSGSDRVHFVWPDSFIRDGEEVSGLFLCCFLAGQAAGIVPHQSQTNLGVQGVDSVPKSTKFNATQLNRMAEAGVWIVMQDLISGEVFNRHAVTAANYDDIDLRESVLVRNRDSVAWFLRDSLNPYVAMVNTSPTGLARLEAEINSAITELKSRFITPLLGGQIVDGSIVQNLRQHAILRDNVLGTVRISYGYPVNIIDLTVLFGN